MTESDDNEAEEALRREALAWLARFSLGEVAEEDLVALRRWRDASPAHAAALAEAGRLWADLEGPLRVLGSEGATEPSRKEPVVRRSSRRMFLMGGAAVAASAAGVMMVRPPLELWPSIAELAADHRTGTGERQHLALADKVSVDLNTRTSISLRSEDQDAGIELVSGEASVTVGEAEKPFVVFAAEGHASALRATFNVRRQGAAVRWTCIDGEIAVAFGGRTCTLGPAQRVTYDPTGLGEVAKADLAVDVAWRSGILVFRNTPLGLVIDEVNRYRSGRIILLDKSLGGRLVTARFEIARLDTVMNQIGNVFKVPVKTLPGGLVLVG